MRWDMALMGFSRQFFKFLATYTVYSNDVIDYINGHIYLYKTLDFQQNLLFSIYHF